MNVGKLWAYCFIDRPVSVASLCGAVLTVGRRERLGGIQSRESERFQVRRHRQVDDVLRRAGPMPQARRLPGSRQHHQRTSVHRRFPTAGNATRWQV